MLRCGINLIVPPHFKFNWSVVCPVSSYDPERFSILSILIIFERRKFSELRLGIKVENKSIMQIENLGKLSPLCFLSEINNIVKIFLSSIEIKFLFSVNKFFDPKKNSISQSKTLILREAKFISKLECHSWATVQAYSGVNTFTYIFFKRISVVICIIYFNIQ